MNYITTNIIIVAHKVCQNNHRKIKILSILQQSQSMSIHTSVLDHQLLIKLSLSLGYNLNYQNFFLVVDIGQVVL